MTSVAPQADPAAEQARDLQEAIHVLVAERQAMRACGVDRAQLERNRLELVRLQWRLSQAFIRRHLRQAAEPVAVNPAALSQLRG